MVSALPPPSLRPAPAAKAQAFSRGSQPAPTMLRVAGSSVASAWALVQSNRRIGWAADGSPGPSLGCMFQAKRPRRLTSEKPPGSGIGLTATPERR